MNTIKKGIATTIYLEQPSLPQSSAIQLTIVGEDGAFIKDSAGNDISGVNATYDSTSKLFKCAITISDSSNEQFIRLYWSSTNAVILDSYYPQDAKLAASILVPAAEIVPVSYFTNYYQNVRSSIDPDYQSAVDLFMQDKIGLISNIYAAQSEIERELEIYLLEREAEAEQRDNYFDRFNMNLWFMQVTHPPINELISVEIWYGSTQITGIGLDLFTFDRLMGIIEFLPLPSGDSAGLYNLLLTRMSGLGLAILSGGILDRIPNMFRFKYKTGLWCPQTDLQEKESIRTAICRRTLINLAYVDPSSRKGAMSETIDGVTASNSYTADKFYDRLQKDEIQWFKKMRQRYGKEVNMVVA